MFRSRDLWKVNSKDHAVAAPTSTTGTNSATALHHYRGLNLAVTTGSLDGAKVEEVFAVREGLDGLRSTIAELHVHRALSAADTTATHIGGNKAIRDHELFNNTAWINTKTAFPTSNPDVFGFSRVNWSRARNPDKPELQLDLVALVQLHPSDLEFRDADGPGIEIRWIEPRWWLLPASVLFEASAPDGKSTVRSLVPVSVIGPFEVTKRQPLTTRRLTKLIRQNEIARPEQE